MKDKIIPKIENPADILFFKKDDQCSKDLEGTIETFIASQYGGSLDRGKAYKTAIGELEKTLEVFKLDMEL